MQSIPVFDEVLGRVVYWQVWSQGRGVEKSMYVLDGAGRRITGVQEVRTLPGECLLVLRAQR